MFEARVKELLEEALAERPDLFLIELNISEQKEIKVVLDGDQGVTVEDCIAFSRKIEHNLDREEEDFSLEVMSAGATAPLTNRRQYAKNKGRTLEVKTNSGEKLEGELIATEADAFVLQWKAREPKPVGKGKITVQKEARITYDEVAKATVKIKFN
ncbi:ribosome assembly cofactor RimP [Croceiramulus getboli]|nr:ribosome assembly cofactor RimP [Flavobacteriaceae bacterium YJPT1-3]